MSFEDLIQKVGSPYAFLSQPTPPIPTFPYPMFHTNWRDEQRGWALSATLYNQSWHMADLFITGPDAIRLLSETSTNTYKNFHEGTAKQYLAVNEQGYVIGDDILFAMPDGVFVVVGEQPAINWLEYKAKTGGYDVQVRRENGLTFSGVIGETPKSYYRYEIEGPNAQKILEKAAGKKVERVPFFKMAELELGGLKVHALGHTMAAAPGADNQGMELFGPEKDHQAFLDMILEAGEPFGLLRGGAMSYITTQLENGWIPCPLPAIYGDDMKEYRQQLPDDTQEVVYGAFGLRGSFHSDRLEDWYMTPWDLGYKRLVRFDHDFIGRAALERLDKGPKRTQIWLVWNPEDTARVLVDSELDRPNRPRLLPWPATLKPYDQVLGPGGKMIGVTQTHGYSGNVGGWVSLTTINEEDAIDGKEVRILWGDYDGGAGDPYLPNHSMTEIRATVHTTAPAWKK